MHHTLDTKPIPEKVLYINEPDLADATINYYGGGNQEEESQADHVRVYVPLDLSADAILRRLRFLVCRYKEANEHVLEIYRDMQKYIDSIAEDSGAGAELWREFRTLMTNKFERLSNKYAPSNSK